MLDPSITTTIDAEYPCRLPQLLQLSALIGDDSTPSPQAFLVHGLEATGKTLITRTLLQRSGNTFSLIASHECITARQLTERIGTIVTTSLGAQDTPYPRCENVNVLTVHLQQLLREHAKKYFLVLDSVDQLRDAPPTLLPGLRRMAEIIPNLTVIFIVSVPHPAAFAAVEMPHIHFPPYTKDESISILCESPLRIKKLPSSTPTSRASSDDGEDGDGSDSEPDLEEELHVWQKFCGTVWDSLAKGAARNIVQFRAAVEKNWWPFIQPIARGEYGTRNYASLYLLNKDMFRREDTVVDNVLPASADGRSVQVKSHDLPFYSRYLLCASYLASYNPPRLDAQFFMKASDGKKRRRGGGGGGPGKRAGKTRKISRRLLGAQAFPMERLMAIFHAIIPHDIAPAVDILAQVATLTSLRLLVKASVLDPLDGATKWKVNVGWDYIRGVARSIKFDIEDRLAE